MKEYCENNKTGYPEGSRQAGQPDSQTTRPWQPSELRKRTKSHTGGAFTSYARYVTMRERGWPSKGDDGETRQEKSRRSRAVPANASNFTVPRSIYSTLCYFLYFVFFLTPRKSDKIERSNFQVKQDG